MILKQRPIVNSYTKHNVISKANHFKDSYAQRVGQQKFFSDHKVLHGSTHDSFKGLDPYSRFEKKL